MKDLNYELLKECGRFQTAGMKLNGSVLRLISIDIIIKAPEDTSDHKYVKVRGKAIVEN